MSVASELGDFLKRFDAVVCCHRKFETARRALVQHVEADGPARCVVCGPPLVGKTTLVNEVFGSDETSIVVPAPTGTSSGQQNPAMELLEAACRAGGAPMIDGFIDPEPIHQPALPFTNWPIERPRRFGRSWESSEQVALRGFARMVKHRGHRRLVLDGTERMFDASATRRRIPWLLNLVEEAGIRLVLVCRDHAAARIVGDVVYGGDFALVRLQRYSDPENPVEMEGWLGAVEMLLSEVPEIRIPPLEEKCLGKFFRHSLGCFGLLHEQLHRAIGNGQLRRQGKGPRTMTVTQARLDRAARPTDALARLLRTVMEGEEQVVSKGQLDVTGEKLDEALGSYEPVGRERQSPGSKENGIHGRKPGDRNPTREVGNREFATPVCPDGAEG